MNKEEKDFGKGAVKDKSDPRDYQFSAIASALAPFDWSKGFDIEKELGAKLIVKDQNGSGSCGGQAWSYLGAVLDPDHDEKSAKFIYAQTFVPPAGSGGRENCSLVITKGWGSEKLTPSYLNGLPPSEAFMEKKDDITPEAFKNALLDTALSYANVRIDIDAIAQAIQETKGVILGVTGKNNGTWTSPFPLPPDKINADCWNHWLYAGKAKVVNGKKYIGVLNSWSENVGEKGWQWLSEDYFISGAIWSAWTLVYNFPRPKPIFKTTMRFGSRGGEVADLQRFLGIGADGIFGTQTKNAVIKFQKAHKLDPDGIVGAKTRAELNK